jgi:cytochrome c55X
MFECRASESGIGGIKLKMKDEMKRGLALGLITGALAVQSSFAGDITPEHASRLVRLVRQDCGSCHGLRLSGGLGPSLLPGALEGKPAEYLVATILSGRNGTPMPPWRGLLTEQEAQWIVQRLQTEFPKE